MSPIKRGSTVTFEGEVITLGDDHCRVRTPSGCGVWIPRDQLHLVEPPLFSVGDEVKTGRGPVGIIDRITPQEVLHRVVRDDGGFVGTFTANWLKHAPPKPEYRVDRIDDELQLEKVENNPEGRWSARAPMSDPEAVQKAIVAWADGWGIDADAARKLAAEPQVIDRYKLKHQAYAVAIRDGCGWHVQLVGRPQETARDAIHYGDPQNESIGRGIFPETEGLYKKPT